MVVIKSTDDGQAIYINGFPMGGSGTVGNYTMYVNPYMVVTNMKFTKHFYIEGQRIVSKLGEMGEYQYLLNPKDTLAGGGTIDFDLKGNELKEAIYANFEDLGLDGAVFTTGKSGKVPYGRLKKYYRNQDLVNAGDGNTNQPDYTDEPSNKIENLQFYYHPDHLGSSSYITDISGEVYQHMEYFPFGETFIEERTDAEYTSYLYNGKELDEETGLYYYGARYYDPRISMFYGVDRFAEKYLAFSPYHYCKNNPIVHIDINGDSTFVAALGNGSYNVVDGSLLGDDKGVYVVNQNKDGSYQLTGSKIGESLLTDSFYNYDSDGHGPGFYGTININSTKGRDWLNSFVNDAPTLIGYTTDASSYNYKDIGIGNRAGDDAVNYKYRGGKYSEGVFASARDIGNIAAGYAAGNGGLDYGTTRFIFDSFQATGNQGILGGMWQTLNGTGRTDAPNSQRGQRYGWEIGESNYRSRVNKYWQRKWGGL